MSTHSFTIDDQPVSFKDGQTIIQAALAAGIFIPHLCYHSEFKPHGSCRLCTVEINGRKMPACTTPAAAGQQVLNHTAELNGLRRILVQMLFIEGNHFCPSCEKSGNCRLQATGYWLQMLDTPFPHFFPRRELDASHPDVLLDRDRCIFCELCVHASRDVDHKNVFALSGRGIHTRLIVDSPSGKLGDSNLSATDKAMQVCPTGALLTRGEAFHTPIGKRLYDQQSIAESSFKTAAATFKEQAGE